MRYLIALIFIAAIHSTLFAQIVNVESQRMQKDTTGWFGNFGSGFLFERNAVKVVAINVSAYVEYQNRKSDYLFYANYSLLEGNGHSLNDNTFYHVRYNYKLSRPLHWEAFTQLQQNDITGIKFRRLVGTGPRFKLVESKKFILHAATAVMYEYEKEETTPVISHNDIRSTSYISLNYKPSENAEITGAVFYQPLFRNYHDYRVLNEITAKLKLVKHFSFKVVWYYLHDSKPAAGTPKFNYSISNGIQYDF